MGAFASGRQRRYMFANHPRIARRMAQRYKNKKRKAGRKGGKARARKK